ncbi:MAG: recombinase RecA [Phycisphaerales bacterium]|nr:recombinase RecA [Phycisphaerales bacterium]
MSAKSNGRLESTEVEREENRKEALGRAVQQIEKSFGKGAIMYLSEQQGATVDGVSTGSISLDLALGGAGIPRGRVVEIYGPESSGKTTLTLHIIAEAQRAGGLAAFIDVEHAFDPVWAKRLGVNLEDLMINQPSCGEEALEICEYLVRSNALDVIVVDSVAALVPRAELEGQMGDTHVGIQARLMSQAMRKLTGISAKSRTSVLFINQIREKIGVMYGSPETTPGGRALKFYSSVRIDIRKIGMLQDGDQAIGTRVRAKVVKNKVAPPFRQAEFDILFESGMSREGDVLDLAAEAGVITRAGTWFSYGEARMGQGRDNARQFLRDNPDIMAEVRAKVLALKVPPRPGTGDAAGAAPATGTVPVSDTSSDDAGEEKKRGRATVAAPPVRKVAAAASRKR